VPTSSNWRSQIHRDQPRRRDDDLAAQLKVSRTLAAPCWLECRGLMLNAVGQHEPGLGNEDRDFTGPRIMTCMSEPLELPSRPRRLRLGAPLRTMLQRVALRRGDFIVPVFVREGSNVRQEVASMPGVFQMSVDVAAPWLAERAQEGFGAYLVFGVIDRARKDPAGSAALDPDNVVCKLLRAAKAQKLPMLGITDLCFCEYTSHGHCGVLSEDRSTVRNDETVQRLVTQALHHAQAGAEIVAPSGMMDGAVAALRRGLDGGGFHDVSILSYAVKYTSAFYGPFRDAADSAPEFGDRRSYQMDPARGVDEAIREAELDVEQGADLVMVKPAGAYLDIISAVRQAVRVPVVAYQVSGEYAMLEAAARNGWLDRERAVIESLTAIKRAGADLIITYYAELLGKLL
jgi:porphobilinogen synthase